MENNPLGEITKSPDDMMDEPVDRVLMNAFHSFRRHSMLEDMDQSKSDVQAILDRENDLLDVYRRTIRIRSDEIETVMRAWGLNVTKKRIRNAPIQTAVAYAVFTGWTGED